MAIKQNLKYNHFFLPKEDRQAIDLANLELWNDITLINMKFPEEEIVVDHVVKDYGHSYGIDMKLSCSHPTVQGYLDDAYERNMRIPRFTKRADFVHLIDTGN